MMTEESEPAQPSVIDVGEMAFAIALFVAAARGKVTPPSRRSPPFSVDARFPSADPLLSGARLALGKEEEWASDEVPLACAVSVLWHHYEQDPRQQSICSRLVAFYSLMVRSRGSLLDAGTIGSIVDPASVALSPAIVEAVASTPVSENGQFIDAAFRARVRALAEQGAEKMKATSFGLQAEPVLPQSSTAIPITDVVEQLSIHLYAFESCVANPQTIEPKFRAIEQLCGRIASVNGNTGLQTLLSRALVATRSDFPWIRSASASGHGTLEGLDRVQPVPDPEEAMRCELAILGSLIELLRSFLGDGITLQLLRSLWPLASLDRAAHT